MLGIDCGASLGPDADCLAGPADHLHRSHAAWPRHLAGSYFSMCLAVATNRLGDCSGLRSALPRARRRQAAELRPSLIPQKHSAVCRFNMKLACISKPFSSEQVRIMLTGDLNAGLHR